MNAIAAEWNTTDATIAEGPRRGSGCRVKRVIVREDLMRRVDSSLFGFTCYSLDPGNRSLFLVRCYSFGTPP
jgi:hypothetical protein